DLDLYVCNYVDYDLAKIEEMKRESKQGGKSVPSALNPIAFEAQDNVLFRNDGDGTFTDVTAKLEMEANGGRSMQAIFTDFDLDGDLDLYVANDLTPNFVYENSGDGTFADVSSESWAADFRGSMGLATGDYDSDGDLDLFISHWIDQENTLYRNLCTEGSEISNAKSDKAEPIRFIDESYGSLLAEISMKDIGWGTDFFDYDNDADLDIFVANGSTFQYLEMPKFLIRQKDRLFRNERDGTFIDVAGEVGVGALPSRVGRGVAFGDYDNDGDVDVFVVNNHDRAVLLRNDGGNRNAWLQVKLVGTADNRDGVGSKIRVVAGDLTQIREINAGASYMSFNSLTAEFGLGQEAIVDLLEVIWSNGTTERFSSVPVNQRVVITQGNGIRQQVD
ncbi:MAG: CRTAC1 family protein, partial [Candidatus Poribacteria bacterium]|nr:CRTAC1 family protein [Candidatus Poribacteria bacterium]